MRTSRRRRNAARPRIELLEDRVVLSTITVVNALDDGPGSLRAAIASAHSGDAVQFAPSLDGRTIHLTGGELTIDKDLTIHGPGSGLLDVDAGGLSRVFDLTSATAAVRLSGLTISGGSAQLGGGVLVQGGSLTLDHASVMDNQAVADAPGGDAVGGGVAVLNGATMSATYSRFQNNLAQGGRGADGGSDSVNGFGGTGVGGAIYDQGTSLSLWNVTFQGNRAIGGRGGDGGAGAGGIVVTTSSGSTFTRIHYAENDFGGDGVGGGVYVQSGSLSISDSKLVDNQALGGDGGDAEDVPYSHNGYGGGSAGGAIYLSGSYSLLGPITFSNVDFKGDEAVGGLYAVGGGRGGARGGAVADESNSTVSYADCLFDSNRVEGLASTFSLDQPGAFDTVEGAAIQSIDSTISVSGSTFINNQAVGGSVLGGVISNYENGPAGQYALTVTDSTFTGNRATGSSVDGGVIYGASLSLTGSTFTGNQAKANDGIDAASGFLAGIDGGMIGGGVVLSFYFTITDSSFTSNRATAGNGGAGGDGSAGGAGGYIEGGVIGTEAIFPWGSFSSAATSGYGDVIEGSTFVANQALAGAGGRGGRGADGGAGGAVHGGDLYVPGWSKVADSTFLGSLAVGGGGGDGGSGGGGGGAGGAVFGASLCISGYFSYSPNLNSSLIEGSTVLYATAGGGAGGAGGDGGGRGGDGGAAQGGALYLGVDLDYIWDPSNVVIEARVVDSIFAGNLVQGGDGGRGGSGGGDGGNGGEAQGGAIYTGEYVDYTEPAAVPELGVKVVDSTILANRAQGGVRGRGGSGGGAAGSGGMAQGGGMMADEYATLDLDGVIVLANSAQGGGGVGGWGVGGGVFLFGPGSTARNSVIVGNAASTRDPDVHGAFG